jgi:hypothetical protein
MFRIKALIASKTLSAMLALLFVTSVSACVYLSKIAKTEQTKLTSLHKTGSAAGISAAKEKLSRLKEASAEADILIFDEATARKWFMETIQTFSNNYGAELLTPVKNVNGAFRTEIVFRFTPETPEDLLHFAEYMENTNAPVLIVNKAAFAAMPEGKSVNITAEIVQPYMSSGTPDAGFADRLLSTDINLPERFSLINTAGSSFFGSFYNQTITKPETGYETGTSSLKEEKLTEYKLESVFIGSQKRFAVIGGEVLKTGDRLGPETIADIQKGKVLLTRQRGERWLYVSY